MLTLRPISHPETVLSRADYDYSTGNLGRHRNECEPVESPGVEMLEDFAHGVTYSPGRFRLTTALWCARRHRPFTIVEDPEFHTVCKMLHPKVHIPSRITVGRDVQLVHRYTKVAVIQMFKVRSVCILCYKQSLMTNYVGHSGKNQLVYRRLDVAQRLLFPWHHGTLAPRGANPDHYSRLREVCYN